jgi:hypothetical protein
MPDIRWVAERLGAEPRPLRRHHGCEERAKEDLEGEQSPWKDRAFHRWQQGWNATDSSAEQGLEVGRSAVERAGASHRQRTAHRRAKPRPAPRPRPWLEGRSQRATGLRVGAGPRSRARECPRWSWISRSETRRRREIAKRTPALAGASGPMARCLARRGGARSHRADTRCAPRESAAPASAGDARPARYGTERGMLRRNADGTDRAGRRAGLRPREASRSRSGARGER